MRKSSLSLLQRFPCPRNQKRTWDLYQRQILMGVKDVKNISLLQTCSVWLRIKPGNPTKENWRFFSATVSRWGNELRFLLKASRSNKTYHFSRFPGCWARSRLLAAPTWSPVWGPASRRRGATSSSRPWTSSAGWSKSRSPWSGCRSYTGISWKL